MGPCEGRGASEIVSVQNRQAARHSLRRFQTVFRKLRLSAVWHSPQSFSPRIIKLAELRSIKSRWTGGTTPKIISGHWRNQKRSKILLPSELCITGYGCEDMFLSDWLSAKAWGKNSYALSLIVGYHCFSWVACVDKRNHLQRGMHYNNGEILGITFKPKSGAMAWHYEPRWFDPWIPNKIITSERDGEKDSGRWFNSAKRMVFVFGFEIWWRCGVKTMRPGYRLLNAELIWF